MQKLSGLVLDRYDDVDFTYSRYFIASKPGFDELEKSAQVFTPDMLSRLPDETFAVILEEGDSALRKYSMADAANTQVSVTFFLELGHRLPEVAQKVAAANLIEGCGWYGIPVPEDLEKVALGIGTLVGGALIAPGAVREAGNNLKAVQGAGSGIMTPNQVKARRLQMGV